MPIAIEFENISKQYRLGLVSTRTLSHDLNRWWTINVLRKEDPYLMIGETNDRSSKGNSEYVWALKDINFKVEQGDVVGIIGKNGAGKSTLLKLLSKVTGPTIGTIKARGRIGSLLEVGTGFHPEMTGRENIFMNGAILGMSKKEIQSKLDEIVDFSGCERYIDTPVKRYSSGMMVRLGFAVAAHLDPEILVVDEVLAVGDAEFQKKAIGKMQDVSKGYGRTVLFVSHNMSAVKNLCRSGIVLENGMFRYSGTAIECIDFYLNGYRKEISYRKFEVGAVKYICAIQKKDCIEICLEYNCDEVIKQPNLGFVVYDQFQTPLFGIDTVKSGLKDFGKPSNIGQISVEIKSPKLVDGIYIIGIWFSDGMRRRYYSNEQCLTISVEGLSFDAVHKSVSQEGYIVPECSWLFNK